MLTTPLFTIAKVHSKLNYPPADEQKKQVALRYKITLASLRDKANSVICNKMDEPRSQMQQQVAK